MKLRNKISNKPLYLIILALYPSISLMALNIREIDPSAAGRSVLTSLIISLIITFIHRIFITNRGHAYIQAGILLVLFFYYGHLIIFIREIERVRQIGNWIHIPFLIVSLLTYLFVRRQREFLHKQTKTINLISLFLLIFPLFQISQYTFSTQSSFPQNTSNDPVNLQTDALPDIYYIIPDQYGRADSLHKIGYDNSQFLDTLREMGFFVADCSIANYRRTALSLASSLNMDYLFKAIPNDGPSDHNAQPVYNALINNRVRRDLKQLGYQIIAFQSGYRWGEWRDADIYLKPASNLLFVKYLTPFENLFIDSTALKIVKDLNWFPFILNSYTIFGEHYERVHYVLRTLPEVATLPGPKFVYAHIIIPHNPYVFFPDGSINPEAKTLHWTNISGYINNLEFINSALESILQQIIQASESPPIIILQGDHGTAFHPFSRYLILNAYYLPGQKIDDIPSSITPVNTFRLIYNLYFGKNFSYKNNVGFNTDIGRPYLKTTVKVPEEFIQCSTTSP